MSDFDRSKVPRPMFAPASLNAQSDDFDLNEVFAEYFINEFEDPLNAYTGGMANYASAPTLNLGGGTLTAFQPSVAPEASKSSTGLPTGGIRTTFHSSTVAASAPDAKRIKPSTDEEQLNADIAATAPTPLSVLASKPALVGLIPSGPEQHQQSSHLGSQQQQRIQLPIGVGLRLGGIGGIAAQQSQQPQSGIIPGAQFSAVNHHIWGAPVMNSGIEGGMLDQNNDGGSSEQQIAERRQRNREHAKRSRVRKKFMLESLQEQVRGLQNENSWLRLMVQEHIPEHAMQIIADCCSKNYLFENFASMNAEDSSGDKPAAHPVEGELVRSDYSLVQSLMAGQKCFVLSDPTLPDNPIVFATPDFYKLTGYTSKEVLGRNCRFLQGPGTDKKAVEVIRRAIATGSDATVCLLNYKSDGTPFWNQFFIGALRDADNNIVNYVGVLTEVAPESAGTSYLEEKVNAVLPLQKDGK